MLVADAILDTISSARGQLGAIQNRLGSTVSNLQTVVQKVADAQSRILDADFAAETAQMTKAQILQQAGLAILAQANTAPQAALSLLRQ
jgi:flagellin